MPLTTGPRFGVRRTKHYANLCRPSSAKLSPQCSLPLPPTLRPSICVWTSGRLPSMRDGPADGGLSGRRLAQWPELDKKTPRCTRSALPEYPPPARASPSRTPLHSRCYWATGQKTCSAIEPAGEPGCVRTWDMGGTTRECVRSFDQCGRWKPSGKLGWLFLPPATPSPGGLVARPAAQDQTCSVERRTRYYFTTSRLTFGNQNEDG